MKLEDQEEVVVVNFNFAGGDLVRELCGYTCLLCSDSALEAFFVSPTGRVIYSPDGGVYEETGENIGDIHINWKCDSYEGFFKKMVM